MKHFETVPLHSTAEDGTLLEHRLPHNGGGSAWSMRGARTALVLLALTSAVSLALSIAALTAVELEIASRDGAPPAATGSGSSSTPTPARAAFVPIRKIAFGSCTSYDLRPQSIWKKVGLGMHPREARPLDFPIHGRSCLRSGGSRPVATTHTTRRADPSIAP